MGPPAPIKLMGLLQAELSSPPRFSAMSTSMDPAEKRPPQSHWGKQMGLGRASAPSDSQEQPQQLHTPVCQLNVPALNTGASGSSPWPRREHKHIPLLSWWAAICRLLINHLLFIAIILPKHKQKALQSLPAKLSVHTGQGNRCFGYCFLKKGVYRTPGGPGSSSCDSCSCVMVSRTNSAS